MGCFQEGIFRDELGAAPGEQHVEVVVLWLTESLDRCVLRHFLKPKQSANLLLNPLIVDIPQNPLMEALSERERLDMLKKFQS